MPKPGKFKPENIPPGSWKEVEVIHGEYRSKTKTVNYIQICREQEMVAQAYAGLYSDGPAPAFPGSSNQMDKASPNASCIVGTTHRTSANLTPSTSKKIPSKISERKSQGMELARKLDVESCTATSPAKIIEAAAPSTHAPEFDQGRADTNERPFGTVEKHKRSYSPEPTAGAEFHQLAKKKAAKKAQAPPKIKIGPIRSGLAKLLKKEIRATKFLATDISAFTDGGEDEWGEEATVRFATPMTADAARAVFFTSRGGPAPAQLPDGAPLEATFLGDDAYKVLGVKSESVRGTLFAPPGMHLPPGPLTCWALPDSMGGLGFVMALAAMMDAGSRPRAGRGDKPDKVRRVGATTLVLRSLKVSCRPSSPHIADSPSNPWAVRVAKCAVTVRGRAVN
jgi:hypothetical protein